MDAAEDVAHRVAVDGGVVELREDRVGARGHAFDVVEALDHVHLPERAVEVQRARGQPRDGDRQLAAVGGLGQADVADVELEVEVLVLDPVGVVEVQRHAHEAAAEDRRACEAALEVGEDVLEADLAARRGRRVVDRDHAAVGGPVLVVEVHEHRVVRVELLHVGRSSAAREAAAQVAGPEQAHECACQAALAGGVGKPQKL